MTNKTPEDVANSIVEDLTGRFKHYALTIIVQEDFKKEIAKAIREAQIEILTELQEHCWTIEPSIFLGKVVSIRDIDFKIKKLKSKIDEVK